ncbi:MAG: hypothetical protein EOO36_22760 [Cytophagaceae bacterium]|nr:MAG: hypothetical protein EOO36_22760 [Cytophagaceae bacterium]
MPYDFFNSMNTGAGQNLDWFWQRWFFDSGYPDLAITAVTPAAGSAAAEITVLAKGSKPVPVDLLVTFADGSTEKLHRTIAVWQNAQTAKVTVAGRKAIKSVTLGSLYVPDSYPADNVWPAQ